jgi:hypothetical protein
MKRNLIAMVLFGLASAQAGVAWGGLPTNGLSINGMPLNGVFVNGMPLNGLYVNGRSLNSMPSSTERSESVAARPRSECILEPERCAIDTPRSQAPGASVQSVRLPDGSIYTVR